tara:strand:+ start:6898 stop:7701 length:804 start_codon:yes stop_codon:yes gene_type:complete
MELRSIFDLPNLYPEDKDILSAYKAERPGSNTTVYTGLFEKNQIKLSDLSDPFFYQSIQVAPNVNFQFIVKFSDDTLFTSQTFLDKLTAAKRDQSNPYIYENTIPIIKFNDNLLTNYSKKPIFDISEQYAEVEVTDTLNTKQDYLLHINYLTTSDSGNSPLKNADEMGSWEVKLTDELGMDHQKALDELESVEEDFSDDEPGVDIVTTNTNNITSVSGEVETVSQLYPPFGFRGRSGPFGSRDKRRLGPDGFYYRWNQNENRWEKRN